MPNGTEVLAKQARLAVQISLAGYGRQSLWVAPIKGGGFCSTASICALDRSVPLAATLLVTGPRPRIHVDAGEPREARVFVRGHTLMRGAAKLAAHYEDGSVDRTPIAWMGKPIEAGFFIYEIPKSHWDPGTRLVALTAESAGGRVLARDTTSARAFRRIQKLGVALPVGVRPKAPPPPPQILCSDTCRDPEGDAGSSLDITNVKVRELGSELEVALTVKGAADLVADGALIAIDVDQNPDTGSAYYGTELEVALVGGDNGREAEPVLYKADGWDFHAVSLTQPPGELMDPTPLASFFRSRPLGRTRIQDSTSLPPASGGIPTRHPTSARSRSSPREERTRRSGRTGVRPSSSPLTPWGRVARRRSSSTGCSRAGAGRGRCSASIAGTGY